MTVKLVVNEDIAIKKAVLYSISQDCFHIERLIDYIKSNI
jgi:hypothetical protein